jgi:hypothetical protein
MKGQSKMVRITQQIFKPFLLVAMLSAVVSLATAQNPEAGKSAQPVKPAYKVVHDHAIGKGRGELLITETGIEFKGEGEDEQRHNRIWRDEEIKQLSISRDELRVTIYEASYIPIIPRKAPFTDGKAVRNGTEHDYLFRLTEGEITPEVVSALLARFNRPVETSVIPQGEMAESRLLFEIPVFHRHRAGGRSGILRVYEQHVVFDADADGDSRFWRYADIRDIGQLGRNRFEIATFEGQFGVDGKSYIFDLKRPLTETEYEALWTKVYAQGRPTGLRPALSHQQE